MSTMHEEFAKWAKREFSRWYQRPTSDTPIYKACCDAWDEAFERGRQLGMSQANALWEMAKTSEVEPFLWCLVDPTTGKPNADLIGSKDDCEFWRNAAGEKWYGWAIAPLYTTPQPAAERVAPKPLTRAQINKLSGQAQAAFCLDKQPTYEVALVREVEAAHGIGTTEQAKEQR